MSRPTPETTVPRLAAALALLATALSIASCVDLEAQASIGPDGSGTLELRYAVSRMVVPIVELESPQGRLPFPLTLADFESAAAGVEGFRIEAFSREEDADTVRVAATLAFDSPSALTDFLDPAGARALYSEEGGSSILRLLLTEGRGNSTVDPAESRLAAAAFSGYELSIAVDLPRPLISSSLSSGTGAGGRGSRASFQSSTTALVESARPMLWEIRW